MEIIGHRGVMGEMPQNTLPSFEKALRAGVRMIELDAELAKTGEVIIFHDDDVNEITRGKAQGPINEFTFAEVRELNVNDGFDDGKVYQVPTLTEVLDLVDRCSNDGGRAKVNIELKGKNTAEPVAKIAKTYLEKGWKSSDLIVSSFLHDELGKFKQLMPEIDIAVPIDDKQWAELGGSAAAVQLAEKMGAVAVNPGIDFVTEELVNIAHHNNLKVNVWTVKTSEDLKRMADMGVDGVFANFLNLDKA